MGAEVTIGLKRAAVLCILKTKESNKILLLKRAKNPHIGKFIPVGGKLEPFEAPIDAARREVFEETGYKVEQFKLMGIMTETSPVKFNWINYIYVADVEEKEMPICSEGELIWTKRENILDLPTPETDWYIYKYVRDNQFFVFSAQYNVDLKLINLTEDISDCLLVSNKRK